jgi:site-specific DNA recombinase
MKAAIWWRVSTRNQLELSPETQIKESRALLEANGYSVPEEYVIGAEWHSLDTLQCPQLQTLLSWVNKGEIQAIGMVNSDRLSGEMAQKLAIMDMAEKKKVRLLAVQNSIETSPDGQLLETVRTYAKYLQVMRSQQGAKQGLRDRVLELGLPATGEPPYGYKFAVSRGPEGKRIFDYTRLIPDDNWVIAKDIWEMALGGMKLRRIVMELYERGIMSPRGCEAWRPKAIYRVLHNPAYAGRYAAMRFNYEKYDRNHQKNGKNTYSQALAKLKPTDEWVFLPNVKVEYPVVDWASFLSMQDRLKANQAMSYRNAKVPYLLRGMIRCEVHNRTYRGWRQVRPSGNSVNFLYRCLGFHTRELPLMKCPKPSMSGHIIEEEVWNRATTLLSSPETVLGGLERQRKTQEESEEVVQSALTAVIQRLNKVNSQEMELVSLRLRGDFGDEIYQKQLSLLKAERTWCQDERERLQSQLAAMRKHFLTIEQVQAMCAKFSNKLASATEEDRRSILESLGTNLAVGTDGRIRLTFTLPDFSDYVSSSRVSDQGTSATSS